MVLQQIDVVGFEALKRDIDLACRFCLGPAVDLGHQKCLVPVPLKREGGAHAYFALAIVVIPSVVEKADAAIDGLVHKARSFIVGDGIAADFGTANADERNFDSCRSQLSVKHFAASYAGSFHAGNMRCCRTGSGKRRWNSRGNRSFVKARSKRRGCSNRRGRASEKLPSFHLRSPKAAATCNSELDPALRWKR